MGVKRVTVGIFPSGDVAPSGYKEKGPAFMWAGPPRRADSNEGRTQEGSWKWYTLHLAGLQHPTMNILLYVNKDCVSLHRNALSLRLPGNLYQRDGEHH